jgi:hypothetical protein
VTGRGTDRIFIELDDTSAFLDNRDNTLIEIKAQYGKGVRWCIDHIGVQPHVIYFNFDKELNCHRVTGDDCDAQCLSIEFVKGRKGE